MTIFLVERYLADVDLPALDSLARRLRTATAQLRAAGTPITYLDSTFVPEDECCFCRLDALSVHAVAQANHIARAPFSRISAAVVLGADEKREPPQSLPP